MVVVGVVFCGLFLYEVLTQSAQMGNFFIISGFIFFACVLLVGIWQLTKKKSISAVNIDSRKYKLYLKGNKLLFIIYSGSMKTLLIVVILFISYFTKAIPFKGDMNLTEILFLIVFFILFVLMTGYFEYRKYQSFEDSDGFKYKLLEKISKKE